MVESSQTSGSQSSEELLRESEERYRRLFDENLSGNFIAKPDGTLLACNPAFARIFGCHSIEDISPRTLVSFHAGPEEWEKFVQLLCREKKLGNYETRLARPDQVPVYVLANVVGRFNEQDELLEIAGYVIDNTERKKLEEQLQQAQKLESLGLMASGIAHDFNNILNIIQGYSSFVAENMNDPSVVSEGVQTINSATRRGAGLVRHLLTFAQKSDVKLEATDLNNLIDELVKLLTESFPKTIHISCSLDPGLPMLTADSTQLELALLNICVNARDAIVGDGAISISTKLVQESELRERFPALQSNQYVCIQIADTGRGMDAPIRSRIFDPFFTTKERERGLGLGLSLVHGVIASHQGFIDVESETGRGTNFCVYLPLGTVDPPEALAPGKRFELVPAEPVKNILVVEDEGPQLQLLTKVLARRGYQTLVARDGLEALDTYKYHQQEISLIILDLGLPKLNGWEVFLQIKQANPQIKTIVVSGYLTQHAKSEMYKQGVKAVVEKPFTLQQILQTIQDVC